MPRPSLPTPGVSTGWGTIINNAVNSLSDLIDGLTTSKADLASGKLPVAQLPVHTSALVSDFAETARDVVGAAIGGGGVITVTVNDAADTITITSTATANSTDAQLRDRSTHTGTQLMGTISDSGAVGRNVFAADSWSTGLAALGIPKPVVWCDFTDNARPTLPANALLIVRGGSLAQAPTWMIDDDWYLERTT